MSEKQAWKINGFVGIFIILLLIGLAVYAFFTSLSLPVAIGLAVLITIIVGVLASGFTIVQPNEARVLTFLVVMWVLSLMMACG